MKRKLLSILVLTISVRQLLAQHEANNWYFGWNVGITFSTNPPTFLSGGQIYTQEGCSSISDSNGNLLFYSDGSTVWDRNHDTMPNGSGLLGGYSSTQSCLIVHDPGNVTRYYLFTAPVQYIYTPLAYSVIDMTLNSGNGDVIIKNVIMLDTVTEKLTAVYHSNGTDIWIIAHKWKSARFHAFLLTSSGVSTTPVISIAGSAHSGFSGNVIGYMKASPCGDKLAVAVSYANILEIFDFNNSTGVVSNPIQLFNLTSPPNGGVYGVEFSPNGSKLYTTVSNPPSYLIQYNMLAGSAAAIIASADTVGYPSGSNSGALQTGPDGKIYMAKSGQQFLACINNPNLSGNGCNFIDNYIPLSPSNCRLGLPNYLTSYFCDLNVNTIDLKPLNTYTIYPNPTSDYINIQYNLTTPQETTVSLFNVYGQKVFIEQENNSSNSFTKTINLSSFSKGIYLLDVRIGRERTVKKIVKE